MRLVAQLDIFPPFLDLIHAFGYRLDDVGDDFQDYHHTAHDVSVGSESGTVQGISTSTRPLSGDNIMDRDLFQHSIS